MSVDDVRSWIQLLQDNLPALVWFLAIYVLLELVLDVVKKSPIWLFRRILEPVHRFWSELHYLSALINNPDLKRWAHQYVTLRAMKARPAKGTAEPRPLLDILQEYVRQSRQAVVLGEPGAGKTTALEALTYRLTHRAFRRQVAVWLVFLGLVALLTTFHSWWWGLLLLTIPLFDLVFRRWPLPLFIELRHYDGGDMETFLKQTVAGRVGGQAVSDSLRGYVERRRLVWLLDGVNEVRGEAYESALDDWQEHFTPGHYFAHAAVMFTSRTGENPARRLGLEEVLEVLDLDDEGAREFLRAYGSRDVEADFAALERNRMLGERGLGRNPYWLKMMVESGLYTRNRGALFENFARELIQRELDKSPVRPRPSVVPVDDEMEALGHLAYVMSDAGQVGLALDRAEATLAGWLEHRRPGWTPWQILDEAEAATLIRLSQRENRAEFSHQLVQEFFTAYALRLDLDEALRRAGDTDWWETLLILGGLLEEHKIDATKEVGNHDDYRQFVRDVLGDGSDARRLFLALGLLRSAGEPDRRLEHQVMTAFVRNLRRGVTSAHERAGVELARIAKDEVMEALGVLLRDERRAAKEGAVRILGEIRSKTALQILTESLGDTVISEDVARALVSIGELAVEPLIGALGHHRWVVRVAAAKALGDIGEPAIKPLIRVMGDANGQMRQEAIDALTHVGPPAVELLIGALRQGKERVRSAAAQALGKIGDDRAVEPLVATLRDRSAGLRRAAARALGRIGDDRAVEALVVALHDSDVEVRWQAGQALVNVGEPAVQRLIAALRDRSSHVRVRAAEVLKAIGKPAVQSLTVALQDDSVEARRAAVEIIAEIRDARAVELLIGALKDSDSGVRVRAIKALSDVHDAHAVEPLIEMLSDENRWVRVRVARALEEIGDARAVESLIGSLKDKTSGVRRIGAAEALGRIRDARAVPPLVEAFRDKIKGVRWAAAWALVRIGEPAVEQLIGALRHDDSHVRTMAAWSLGKIGDARVLPHLERVAKEDTDSEVADAARKAIERIRAEWTP